MRRLMLLAIGLSALLWAASVRTDSASPVDSVAMIGVETCQLAGDSPGRSDSDRHWRAPQQTVAAVTESMWKSVLLHAALGTTLSPVVFEPLRAASSPDPPVRPALPHLRHTPLLI